MGFKLYSPPRESRWSSQVQQRSLAAEGSEGGGSKDDFLDSVLEECLATATDLESQEEEDEEPAAKIARLELFLRNAASDFEQPRASQPAALQKPEVETELPSYPPTSPPSVGTSTSDSPTAVEPSPQLEADSWLQQIPHIQEPFGAAESLPDFDPNAWLEGIAGIMQHPQIFMPGQVHPPAAAKPSAVAVPSSSGTLQHEVYWTPAAGAHSGRSPSSENLAAGGTDVAEGTPEGAQGSASTPTLTKYPERRPWCPTDHPYVRLPDVDPETKIGDFKPSGTETHEYTLGVIVEPLRRIRELLLRPSLDSREVATLIRAAEALMCNCERKFKATSSSHSPFRVYRNLAMVFLALDALASIDQVLQGKICKGHWWPAFVEPISTDINSYVPRKRMKIDTLRILYLIRQLLSAIEIYKQGRRPDEETVIELKRRIFGPNTAVYPFSARRFDPWRQDDAGTQDGAGHQEGPVSSDSDN
ncbi:hypothetical protein Efla_006624 [Eimeria flavescens]